MLEYFKKVIINVNWKNINCFEFVCCEMKMVLYLFNWIISKGKIYVYYFISGYFIIKDLFNRDIVKFLGT